MVIALLYLLLITYVITPGGWLKNLILQWFYSGDTKDTPQYKRDMRNSQSNTE